MAYSRAFVVRPGVGEDVAFLCRKACACSGMRTSALSECEWVWGEQSYAVASSRLSIGLRKTGFEERQAAIVKTGSRHWKTVASMSICGAGELETAISSDSFNPLFQDEGREEVRPREGVSGLARVSNTFVVPCAGQGQSNDRPGRGLQVPQEQRAPCP